MYIIARELDNCEHCECCGDLINIKKGFYNDRYSLLACSDDCIEALCSEHDLDCDDFESLRESD